MDDRELILSALADVQGRIADGGWRMEQASHLKIADRLETFLSNFQTLGGKIIAEGNWAEFTNRKLFVDNDCESLVNLHTNVESIWGAEVGISLAKAAIAESGSLVFESGPDSHRMTTLAPPVNVVLLRREAIVPYLSDALELIKDFNGNGVIVSGPSRTADIEGILVRGVHGPGELYLSLLD